MFSTNKSVGRKTVLNIEAQKLVVNHWKIWFYFNEVRTPGVHLHLEDRGHSSEDYKVTFLCLILF